MDGLLHLSCIASSTRVLDVVVRALRDDSRLLVQKSQIARVSRVQRTPAGFRANWTAVLPRKLEGEQKRVKKFRALQSSDRRLPVCFDSVGLQSRSRADRAGGIARVIVVDDVR